METAVVARGVEYLQRDCGHGSNNDAEWLALLDAVKIALSIGASDIALLGDSATVINQANGTAKCRSAGLREHLSVFLELKPQFDRVRIRQVGRHQNLAGIALAKLRM